MRRPFDLNESKPYLVQRSEFCDPKSKPTSKGIDRFLRYDYMGSAEYEFGALGDSIRAIRSEIDSYRALDIEVKGKPFTVFCREADRTEVLKAIEGLAEDKFRLKEYCDLSRYVANDTFLPCRNDHWWDITNHFMVWKKNPSFTEAFLAAMRPNAE